MVKIKVAVDTSCIIAIFRPSEVIHEDMLRIRDIHQKGGIELYVSLKTIDQLLDYGDAPLGYAKSLPKLPNHSVGSWKDEVGTWDSDIGTWDDIRKNDELAQKIHDLTKEGVDIRDRQIVVDSYLGGMQVILTNDRDLCDEGPATRLKEELGIVVLSPKKFLASLHI